MPAKGALNCLSWEGGGGGGGGPPACGRRTDVLNLRALPVFPLPLLLDKYTIFSRKHAYYRKPMHFVPKFTKVRPPPPSLPLLLAPSPRVVFDADENLRPRPPRSLTESTLSVSEKGVWRVLEAALLAPFAVSLFPFASVLLCTLSSASPHDFTISPLLRPFLRARQFLVSKRGHRGGWCRAARSEERRVLQLWREREGPLMTEGDNGRRQRDLFKSLVEYTLWSFWEGKGPGNKGKRSGAGSAPCADEGFEIKKCCSSSGSFFFFRYTRVGGGRGWKVWWGSDVGTG